MEYTYIHNHQSQFIEQFGKDVTRKELSSLCDTFIDGDWIESKDQSESGIRLIQTGNVGSGVFVDKEDKARYINEETFSRLNCTAIESGDILISRLPDPVGRACIVPKGIGKAITAVDCSIIRTNKEILPEFLIGYTLTDDYQSQIKACLSGTTRLRISRSNLGKIKIPVPDLDDQQQFVVITQQADKSKFDGFKSQFLEMTRTADRHPIGQLCDIFGGATPARTNKEYWENGTCPWFTVEDLHNQGAHIWKTEQHITEAALKKVKKYPVDTVLLCCTSATIGSVAYSHIPLSSNQQFNGLVVKDRNKLRPEFLFYNCTLLKDELLKQCGKTTFAFVPRGTLEKIEIFCPDIHVQNQFVKVLEQADKSKYYVQNKQNYICHILTNQIQ